ncbi:unnamed protein product [Dibothriocephalus latus]|uniref:TRPM-like domain-containing protein n=1 Tax=Dibothriocephalus latus TaxID=60516 RepID=A0A3P7NLE3_DIBLA|nr:unnamed protein product [Dibothriocephalus latus]
MEVDEEAHGAFYMKQRRPSNVTTTPSIPASRLNSPHGSRRSSRISLKLPQPPPKPVPLNVEDFQEEVVILRRLTEDYAHLVSIFDSDDADMDSYIISALLSSAGLGTPSGMLNTEQLAIAVRLNRADIAKEKIFTEGRSWKINYDEEAIDEPWNEVQAYQPSGVGIGGCEAGCVLSSVPAMHLPCLLYRQPQKHELDTFMFNAIIADQEAFVSLFLENGFDLEAFLTVHMLEKLYTVGLSKRESKSEMIQQLWESCRIYKMDWVMLRDIGRVVRQLLGEFYRPYYLSKRFREVIKRAITRYEAEQKEVLITGDRKFKTRCSYE